MDDSVGAGPVQLRERRTERIQLRGACQADDLDRSHRAVGQQGSQVARDSWTNRGGFGQTERRNSQTGPSLESAVQEPGEFAPVMLAASAGQASGQRQVVKDIDPHAALAPPSSAAAATWIKTA